MKRWRIVVGLIAAAILILSSAMHSILGWKALGAQLVAANVSWDLVAALHFGWLFGGVAMLAFGIIAASIFIQRLRGANISLFPVMVMGLAYVAFGTWALTISGDPFFAIFIVPGVLLLLASWPETFGVNHAKNHAG